MTPPLLRIRLLGGFRLARDGGAPLAERWSRPSARTVVKLLALAPDRQLHREQIMAVCWPHAELPAALRSLRVALHAARHALEPELRPRAASSYLTADGVLLRLARDAVWIDTEHAAALARQALAGGRGPELTAALAALSGELLPEDRYASWAEPSRERLARLRDEVRGALARAEPAAGDAGPRPEADAARVRLDWARDLDRAGRYEEAVGVLREALAAYRRQGLCDAAALAAARLAEVLSRSRGAGAEEALAVLGAHPPGPGAPDEVRAAHHMAWSAVFSYTGRYEEGLAAARAAQRAAGTAHGRGGRILLARSLAQQTVCLGLSGRTGEAAGPAERALAPAEESGDPAVMATVLSVLRETARRAGRYRQALEYGRRALALAEQAGRPTATAFERANLAELHLLLGESAEAERLAGAAVELAAPFGGTALAFALTALARVRTVPAPDDAARLLDRAERCAESGGHLQAMDEVRAARAALAAGRPMGGPAGAARGV
ncbi:AfsR/SARP family transcriptional regulator [Streptomyces chattanoogensis]|uniref:Bacterial transcriptional activator domain-containing protein n=1 Tax=Streptomyces chattanoogensis TaxID=66876 RepID=A0A0N1JWL5_9ACTN|nr:helix-turn-helix domain-containing protein [Streptomyces chattanoogensis]KPC61365.1 hypothetical protein ADL29_24105 [Streptomyces chattanoogensis]